MPQDLQGFWEERLIFGTDIHEHLPFLRNLARGCTNVVEFGVHAGGTTAAFLLGCPGTVDSWDIEETRATDQIRAVSGGRWTFHMESSLVSEPPDCDLVFIDSLHTAKQVELELEIARKVARKWIGLHDTVSFGMTGEDGGPGIRQSINAFRVKHPQWVVERDLTYNNGLMMLQRTS